MVAHARVCFHTGTSFGACVVVWQQVEAGKIFDHHSGGDGFLSSVQVEVTSRFLRQMVMIRMVTPDRVSV